jgi:hypothetical protein
VIRCLNRTCLEWLLGDPWNCDPEAPVEFQSVVVPPRHEIALGDRYRPAPRFWTGAARGDLRLYSRGAPRASVSCASPPLRGFTGLASLAPGLASVPAFADDLGSGL